MPGEHTLDLEPGDYTIFYEYRSVVGGRVYSTADAPLNMNVRLWRDDDGREVELSNPTGSYEYSIESRSGVSLLEFEVETAGTYRIAAEHAGGDRRQVVFAVGQYRLKTVLIRVGLAIAAAIAAIGLGIFLIVRVARAPRAPFRGGATPAAGFR